MEKLQGPINPCLVEEDLDVGWLEEFVSNYGTNYKFEEPYNDEILLPSLEEKMPFLQMLQDVENSEPTSVTPETAFPQMQEPNYFQLLLRLQHRKMFMIDNHQNFIPTFENPTELDSSVTNITNNDDLNVKSETCREEEPVQCVQAQISPIICVDQHKRVQGRLKRSHLTKTSSNLGEGNVVPREKRKRKRPVKVTKNKEEVESQRMTHIAVERNRRRQMNDHLNALRSLMPPSYVQRGDQASIIGGAIDFVKQLEQMLESLQAQKRMRQSEENEIVSAASSTSSSSNLINNMFVTSPTSTFQFRNFDFIEEGNGNSIQVRRNNNNNEEFIAETRSELADIKVVVIQNHVNLKIQCQRRAGQLLKIIVAFEELRLTILHLNITSLHTLVHYSFNLKIEDDCKLRSADDVLGAVHHIFNLINNRLS